eukprot:NODE_33_length_32023_cov_0.217579.p22 type:complete len:123 gc:universal NODE_33_length_32023_cov_0.217579:30189-30557(+)
MRQVSGCVAVHKNKILLITARKSNHWVLPKGQIENSETPESAALRELYEEAGVRATIDSHILEMVMDRKSGQQNTFWYMCHVDEILEKWPEQNERKRQFVSVDEAKIIIKKTLLPVLNKVVI